MQDQCTIDFVQENVKKGSRKKYFMDSLSILDLDPYP